MPAITLEQALFLRPDRGVPRLIARSSGFSDAWRAEATTMIHDFGARPAASFRCPLTVFARPLTDKHVAVVRVRDDHDEALPTGLRFHFLVVDRKNYEAWMRDPFLLAAKIEPAWDATALPALSIATEAFSPRTVAQVQAVLKRVKAAALREGDDPESPEFERTIVNSESPVLLGGAQILVDGGRLVFERPAGDLAMVSGLWLLLPEATRGRLWPASFAFSPALEFDVLVVPHIDDTLEGYTSEEQAADYPQGVYELALQRAAEAGDQRELDAVLSRRDGWQTMRLALVILFLLSLVVLASKYLDPTGPIAPSASPVPLQAQKAAVAAGVVGAGEPWTSLSFITYGEMMWNPEVKAREQK